MATLSESGLSSNLGIEHSIPEDHQHAIALYSGYFGSWLMRTRIGSAFVVPPDLPLSDDGSSIELTKPIGLQVAFGPTSPFFKPVFTGNLPHEIRPSLANCVAAYTPEEAAVTTPDDLAELLKPPERGESRPINLYIGAAAVGSFVRSSLFNLDIASDNQMSVDEKGHHLEGDDVTASRIIQLAEMADVDVKRYIAAAHYERALLEIVTTVLIDKYFWLSDHENIGSLSGNWHYGCMKFARAYGVSADEIADLAMILRDEIKAAAEAKSEWVSKKRRPLLPDLEEDVAKAMARYLIEG